jgi:hypothetical protein
MATYKSFNELKDKQLELGDEVQFTIKGEKLFYTVKESFLTDSKHASNAIIFEKLNISDKNKYVSLLYGYFAVDGKGERSWPEFRENDYEAATRLVCDLFKKCEEVVVDKATLTEEELYEVGDFVKIKEQDDPDHIIGFTKGMIEEYGGRWCRIRKIAPSGWFILETLEGNEIGYRWFKDMFSEHEKNLPKETSKFSSFSFTEKDIPKNCPYHPYVIDQALVEFSKGIHEGVKDPVEAFKKCIYEFVGYWFSWEKTSQGWDYWNNIFKNPSFIPSCYIPTYFIEELPKGAEELVEYCKRDISDAIAQCSSRTSHKSMEIPCNYEEVTLSIKKKKVHF